MTDPHPVSPHNDRVQPKPAAALDPAARKVKTAGIVVTGAGVFILLLMGTVTWRMAPILLAAPGALTDGSRFNADQAIARLVLALFGAVLLFGAVAVAVGLSQATTGRRKKGPIFAIWGAAALVVLLTVIVVFAIKQVQPH